MDREACQENLTLLKSVFDKHGITFWLAYGTCLGAIREQNFIAHDYDIDLDVYRTSFKQVMALIPELNAQGFEQTYTFKDRIDLSRRGIPINISFCYKAKRNKGTLKIPGWISMGVFLEGDFFDQLDTIELFGETYNVPKNPVKYLTYIYGLTWQQPIKENFWYLSNLPQVADGKLEVHRENLQLIKSVFEKNGIRFWLSQNTCRDAVTQNYDLPNDLGVNINTYIENKNKVIEIISELNQCGFECIKASYIQYVIDPISLAVVFQRLGGLIEIEFACAANFYQKFKGYRWICGLIIFTRNFFTQLETIDFLGEKYYVPHNPSQYLDYLYGPIWQQKEFHKLSNDQRIDLLAKILKQETQVELPVRPPWLLNQQDYGNFILYGDILTIKALNMPIHKDIIVLVGTLDRLSIQQVVEVIPNEKIRLKSFFQGQDDTWCTASNIIGQVITLRSRLGFAIRLDLKIIQLMLQVIMPLMLRLRRTLRKT
jgi:phosphorylcholine metabolism protein LicD